MSASAPLINYRYFYRKQLKSLLNNILSLDNCKQSSSLSEENVCLEQQKKKKTQASVSFWSQRLS